MSIEKEDLPVDEKCDVMVQHTASRLLDNGVEVDVWGVAQETGLTEQEVVGSLQDLSQQGCLELLGGSVVEVGFPLSYGFRYCFISEDMEVE